VRVVLVQCNPLVGDVAGNLGKIVALLEEARRRHAPRLVVFPEMVLSGYPPEDLLFHSGFRQDVERALAALPPLARELALVVGHPDYRDGVVRNAASVFDRGRLVLRAFKQRLPNYGVFDEKRYFTPGTGVGVVAVDGLACAVTICEDIWDPGPWRQARDAGARVVLNLSASPYAMGKPEERRRVFSAHARATGLPLLYANLVGGQDELVFDGASLALDRGGNTVARARPFVEDLLAVDLSETTDGPDPRGAIADEIGEEEAVYEAVVLAVRDYVTKNAFAGVLVGLSGGIDSALTLLVAADALGAPRVRAVMMPSRFTSSLSLEIAREQIRALGVAYEELPIEPVVEAFLTVLGPRLEPGVWDAAAQNLQARARGALLMALSNRSGRLLLTTGNKSEMAVGYATLYGDMAGGFAPLRDVTKTWVYRLARWRNARAGRALVPEAALVRPPTAELAPGQLDADALPPYPVLDAILEAYIEDDLTVAEIVARGHDEATVRRVVRLVATNEYKRRQAPPGVRVSRRAFGRERRYPITSGYGRGGGAGGDPARDA
jgi:NAD+ synthase (glutamine-hydrolysing)